MRELADKGKRGFYEGRVAEAIIEVLNARGGCLTQDDLTHHMKEGSEPVDPISIDVPHPTDSQGAVRVWEHPPNGQGIIALMTLGIMQALERKGRIPPLHQMPHNSAQYLHCLISCLHIAFADAAWWVSDTAHGGLTGSELIDPAYCESRAELFDPNQAPKLMSHGSPALRSCDTVYLATTDRDGNGISFINSNYDGFGSCIIPRNCGFTLQNRGSNFALQDGHPNVLAPRKRPYHTIIPAMVTNVHDDSLHSVYGVMGGFMQPQGHVQVLLNMHLYKQTPQAALDAPRVCIECDTADYHAVEVLLEDGIGPEVAAELSKLGHRVKQVAGYDRSVFGRGQVIRCHREADTIVYSGGSDPRGDGAALPC